MTVEQVANLVRGPTDSTVTLTLLHAGETTARDVRVKRAVITVESVLGDLRGDDGRWNFIVSEEPRIGYVRIIKFGDKTAAELALVLAQLSQESKPLDALILDVRDDAGGALDAAVQIADLFLRAGQTIVTTRGRDETVRRALHVDRRRRRQAAARDFDRPQQCQRQRNPRRLLAGPRPGRGRRRAVVGQRHRSAADATRIGSQPAEAHVRHLLAPQRQEHSPLARRRRRRPSGASRPTPSWPFPWTRQNTKRGAATAFAAT